MTHPPTDDGTSEPTDAGRPPQPEPTQPVPVAGEPVAGEPVAGEPVAGAPVLGEPVPGEPVTAPPPAPAKRRTGLIAAASLAIVLLLCGGGGTAAFLLLRQAESGEGAPEPAAAVDAFLQAVYTEQDPAKAAAMVCVESRDETAIAKKVQEVEGYATTYTNPRFRWDPPSVATQNEERAIVSVKLTMTTEDEKLSDQQLRFTVVHKTGWWVCEVG